MMRIIDMTEATSSDEFTFAVWDTVRDRFIRDESWEPTGVYAWTIKEWNEEARFPEDLRKRIRILATSFKEVWELNLTEEQKGEFGLI